MLRKRLLGAVIVRQGYAVQSFGFRRWLPLGKPEFLVENLDRWGVDEIVVLSIDRSNSGPDFSLIESLGDLGLSTPLSYGGGISTIEHAKLAIRLGVERLVLDSVLIDAPDIVSDIARSVGVQALIASLPLCLNSQGVVKHFNYRTGELNSLTPSIVGLFSGGYLSELLVIDVEGDGMGNGFNSKLLNTISVLTDVPILAFGGFATPNHIREHIPLLSGVVIGNSLNYRENCIYYLKSCLSDQQIRLSMD